MMEREREREREITRIKVLKNKIKKFINKEIKSIVLKLLKKTKITYIRLIIIHSDYVTHYILVHSLNPIKT